MPDDSISKKEKGLPLNHSLLDTLGRRCRNRSRYTSVARRVDTCTLDCSQTTATKVSRDGRPRASLAPSLVGVPGGV